MSRNGVSMVETQESTRRGKSRKIRAILAGGLVLGVGTALTLAAWNDSEFATGTFTAGSFNLEGSTTDATAAFDDHPDAGSAAGLTFTLPLADNMSPAEVVYAPFWVRLDDATTSPATLAAGLINSSGANAATVSYEVYALASNTASCDAGGIGGGTLVSHGADLTTVDTDSSVALPIGTPPSTAGEATQLCFVLTAPAQADLTPGVATTVTWEFQATSTS